MGKDPAFLFYPNDYLGGTMGFTMEMHGLYILALIFQFNNGHFSLDQINSFLQNKFSEIEHKFKKDSSGLYYNERIDIEKEKRHIFVESRRKNGRSFLIKKDKPLINKKIDIEHMGVQNVSLLYPHMENENENENEDKNEDENMNCSKKEVSVREKKINPEHRECSELLKTRILERRQQKITDQIILKWDNEVRLMIDRDKRTCEDIKKLINECHDMEPRNGFTWRDNILSMAKLRERWNEGKIYVGMNDQYGGEMSELERMRRIEKKLRDEGKI